MESSVLYSLNNISEHLQNNKQIEMKNILFLALLLPVAFCFAQQTDKYILLKPDRVFDG